MVNRDGNGWTTCDLGHRHWGRFGAAGLLAYAPGQADLAGRADRARAGRVRARRADMAAARAGRAGAAGRGGAGRAEEPGREGPAADGGPTSVLLQRRSWWGNHGGTWGPPGGARDSHESAVTAALREAQEECAMPAGAVSAQGILVDDHGGWSYQTVVAAAPRPFPVRAVSNETSQAAWVPAEDVAALDLHPGFAAWWPVLREALQPLTIIVDTANVMGSRPDGWWRDRAGAARRLRDQLAGRAARGVTALPDSMRAPALDLWFPEIVLVVEGAARSVAAAHAARPPGSDHAAPGGRREHGRGAARDPGPGDRQSPGPAGAGVGVRVVAAPGSGDDTIAAIAGDMRGRRLVVTADRELRGRCVAAGASVTGPGWLLGQL